MQSSRQGYLTQRTQQTVMLSYLSIGATRETTPDCNALKEKRQDRPVAISESSKKHQV